jgi:hypothetical protein
MLYREIIAVCSQIHTKHINTLCGQNVIPNLVVHIVTTVLRTVHYGVQYCIRAAFHFCAPLVHKATILKPHVN